MNNAMKAALADMKEEGINTSYLYFSKAILTYTKENKEQESADFRRFNKKSLTD